MRRFPLPRWPMRRRRPSCACDGETTTARKLKSTTSRRAMRRVASSSALRLAVLTSVAAPLTTTWAASRMQSILLLPTTTRLIQQRHKNQQHEPPALPFKNLHPSTATRCSRLRHQLPSARALRRSSSRLVWSAPTFMTSIVKSAVPTRLTGVTSGRPKMTACWSSWSSRSSSCPRRSGRTARATSARIDIAFRAAGRA